MNCAMCIRQTENKIHVQTFVERAMTTLYATNRLFFANFFASVNRNAASLCASFRYFYILCDQSFFSSLWFAASLHFDSIENALSNMMELS